MQLRRGHKGRTTLLNEEGLIDDTATAAPRRVTRSSPSSTTRWYLRVPRPGLGPLAGLVAVLSSLVQLMVHPVLGLADNGDYKRVLSGLHLVAVVPPGQSSSFRYIWLDYLPGGPPHQNGYASSELVLAHLVQRGNTL